ncbi:hypothetical protein LCGC14_1529100 [marine sediment metagenome]|uniref:Uncharacterized protein n=1 Tax=marine sediment metagenome TaxID=412755 RepID=A0A0F9JH63_9ZZZZ
MPVEAELEAVYRGKHPGWIVGFNQHRGLHILIEDGSVLTFFRDEVKKITPIKAPFPYKENSAVMSIRTEQSQQWAENLPELALGENEIQFNFGRTRKQVESAQKEIGKPERSKPRQKTAASHWLGIQ